MVGGSQVPNLLQPDAAATLVVSHDVDLVVPVAAHRQVRDALARVTGYQPSAAEPSVWLPDDPQRLEINFIGRDPSMRETADSYVLEDTMLLGNLAVLSLMQPLPGMPDPTRGRAAVEALLTRLQAVAR